MIVCCEAGCPARRPMATRALLLGVMTGFGFALLLREVWCHWYYPVRGRLYWRWNQPELAAVAWRAYLHTPTLCGRRRKRSARLFLAHCLWRLDDPGAALAECERLLALRCEQGFYFCS